MHFPVDELFYGVWTPDLCAAWQRSHTGFHKGHPLEILQVAFGHLEWNLGYSSQWENCHCVRVVVIFSPNSLGMWLYGPYRMRRGSRCGFWQCCLYFWLWLCCIFGDFPHAAICYYCRASHTGDAIRAMYSSVSVGFVHVLCACAQVQSTVWRSCQPHLVTILPHLFVAFLRLFFFFFFFFLFLVLVLLLLLVLLVVVVVVVVATQLILYIFAFCGPLKIVK